MRDAECTRVVKHDICGITEAFGTEFSRAPQLGRPEELVRAIDELSCRHQGALNEPNRPVALL